MRGRQREDRARVLGPYYSESRQQWRITIIRCPTARLRKDREATRFFDTEEKAKEAKRTIELQICNVTVERAIDEYAQYLLAKGTKGCGETIRRLRLFFAKDLDTLIGRLTTERCEKLYAAFRSREVKPYKTATGLRQLETATQEKGPTVSVSYHRAVLINARSLMKFCKAKRWIDRNPFSEIEGVGKRNSGKHQPTADELVRWHAYVWGRAQEGHEPALALMLDLALALRSGDICRRLVRHVDMGGTQLHLDKGKTKSVKGSRAIPKDLQPFVRALVAKRDPMEPLFKTKRRENGHHKPAWLWQAQERFCRLANVPHFCPHALKGIAGSILADEGETGEMIMRHLWHESLKTSTRHYVSKGAIEAGQSAQVYELISRGNG